MNTTTIITKKKSKDWKSGIFALFNLNRSQVWPLDSWVELMFCSFVLNGNTHAYTCIYHLRSIHVYTRNVATINICTILHISLTYILKTLTSVFSFLSPNFFPSFCCHLRRRCRRRCRRYRRCILRFCTPPSSKNAAKNHRLTVFANSVTGEHVDNI